MRKQARHYAGACLPDQRRLTAGKELAGTRNYCTQAAPDGIIAGF